MKERATLSGASRDSFYLIFVKLVTMTLGLLLTRILADVLSITQFGTYSQVMLLVSTVSSLSILGMIDGTNYFFHHASTQDEKERYMATIIAMQGAVGISAGLLILIFSDPIVQYFKNPELKGLLLFAAVLPVVQNLISMLQVLFVAVGKAKQIAVRNLLISISKLVLYVAASCVLHSLSSILIFTILLDAAQLVYFHRVLRRYHCAFSFRGIDCRLIKKIIMYCLPMAVFIMINSLSRDCDKYVISVFTNTDTLAVYSNASRPLPFDMIAAAYITVLVPYLTRYITQGAFEKARALYRLLLQISGITTAMLALSAMVSAPMLMELLYTKKYLGGIAVFIIYMLVDSVRFLSMTLILAAAGKTKVLICVAVGSLSANLILDILFFCWMGIVGPAAATLAVMTASGLIIQKFSAKILGCSLSDLFNVRYFLLFLLESITAMVIFGKISGGLGEIHYMLRLFIIGGGYFFTMLLLNLKQLLACIRQIGSFR